MRTDMALLCAERSIGDRSTTTQTNTDDGRQRERENWSNTKQWKINHTFTQKGEINAVPIYDLNAFPKARSPEVAVANISQMIFIFISTE